MLVDRWGEPIPTQYVRRPIGFVPRDPIPLDPDENEPPTFGTPHGGEPRNRDFGNHEWREIEG